MKRIEVTITSSRLVLLQDKADEINKRASKLGCTPVALTAGPVRVEPDKRRDPTGRNGVVREVVDVVIEGETPKIAGWTFSAALDHLYGEDAGTIIRAVPGVDVPELYRHAAGNCDHCKLMRNRKSTYLLEKDGEWKQVGSTCLRDFIGAGFEPEAIAALAEAIIGLMGESDNEGSDGCSQESMWTVDAVLAFAVAHIRMDGFASRKHSRESGGGATADAVISNMMESRHNMPEKTRQWFSDRSPTDADQARAAQVLGWMRSLVERPTSISDYEHNLATVARGGVVTWRQFGLVVSAPAALDREQGKIAERAHAAATSKHFGTVGKRETWSLTVTRINTIDGNYGATWIIGFVDDQGNQAVWFASSNPELEIGTTYMVKGTVKAHNNYKGVAQTALARCLCARTELPQS